MKATTRPTSLQPDLTATRVLAALLERLEHSQAAVDAQQYRSVVRRLSDALARSDQSAGLDAVLEQYPASRELYENLNYQHAGLCRSALDAALSAELTARRWITQARQRTSN